MTEHTDNELGQRFLGLVLAMMRRAETDADLMSGDLTLTEGIRGGLVACLHAVHLLHGPGETSLEDIRATTRVVLERWQRGAPEKVGLYEGTWQQVEIVIENVRSGEQATPSRDPRHFRLALEALLDVIGQRWVISPYDAGQRLSMKLGAAET